MKCNIINYFLLSSLILGVLDIGFFIYGSVDLYDLRLLKNSIHCSDYYNYCFYTNFIFLLSILVILSFVWFVKSWPVIPLIMLFINLSVNLGIGIDNFVNKNNYCDIDCRNHCAELTNYGDNFTIFMITNLSCFGAILIGFTIFSCT
jgi:hypothetical protein